MTVLKWIGVFLLYWIIGSIVASIIDITLYFLGGSLGQYGNGLVILIVIILGLYNYGKKKKKNTINAVNKVNKRGDFS